jgi:hypothetical protein
MPPGGFQQLSLSTILTPSPDGEPQRMRIFPVASVIIKALPNSFSWVARPRRPYILDRHSIRTVGKVLRHRSKLILVPLVKSWLSPPIQSTIFVSAMEMPDTTRPSPSLITAELTHRAGLNSTVGKLLLDEPGFKVGRKSLLCSRTTRGCHDQE